MEKWKDIEGFEGLYQVSNFGRVKSLQKKIWNTINKSFSFYKEKILKQGTSDKYKQVVLRKNNKSKTFKVHRLVALAFIPNPENKPEVNHKDSDRANNNVLNLEWCTSLENTKHACLYGIKKVRSVVKLSLCGELLARFDSTMDAGRSLGKSKRGDSVGDCCRNKQKTAYGFKWMYESDYKQLNKSV